MARRARILNSLLALALLARWPDITEAKSYSSGGGHSYSHSSSSHSSSFSHSGSSGFGGSSRSSGGGGSSRSSGGSGSKSFSSGSGKSYSSGSSWSDTGHKSYSASKSYSSGAGKSFSPAPGAQRPPASASPTSRTKPDSSGFTFDTAAARARKQEASREQFTQFKQAQNPPANDATRVSSADSYRAQPPPVPVSGGGSYRAPSYIPDSTTISTRPVRIYNVFNGYTSRPWITYHDPYSSLFWWWLLDRTLDERAWWAYHHRYDMDPARYDALLATDAQLQARVSQLEAQQAARDPNYVPPGLGSRDLMYSDQYVSRSYSNRPTLLGVITFWVFGIPLAIGVCVFFIWLIWFKRWQTAS
jgi:hypothetical protein